MLVVVSLRTSYAFFTDNLSGNVTIDVLRTQNGEMRVGTDGVVTLSSSSGPFNYGHFTCSYPASTNFD